MKIGQMSKMREEKTGKERFTEQLYLMEKNSFILNILEARTAAVLHGDSCGYSDSEMGLICHISPVYVKLIKAVRTQHPGSIEDIAQELYDRIYTQTGWKRDYSRLQLYDENLIAEWFELKQRERQLRAGNIDLDDFIATAKHAYWSKTGKDVDVIIREIEEKPEQKQQETEPESEPETEGEDFDFFKYHMRETEAKLLCKMFRNGVIDEPTALEYLDEPNWDHDTFQRVVDIYAGEEKETEIDDNSND